MSEGRGSLVKLSAGFIAPGNGREPAFCEHQNGRITFPGGGRANVSVSTGPTPCIITWLFMPGMVLVAALLIAGLLHLSKLLFCSVA
jgi:hypothetical protein